MKTIFTIVFQLILFSSLFADNITVTNTNDSGPGSLRDAFNQAEEGDVILFDPSLANQTIVLTSGNLATSFSITIDGENAPGLTIDGNNNDRIMGFYSILGRAAYYTNPALTDFNTIAIKNLRFINGNAVENDNGKNIPDDEKGSGGAIYIDAYMNASIENCIFEDNTSNTQRGGSAVFIGFSGTMTIHNSQFRRNFSNITPTFVDGEMKYGERGGTISTNGKGILTVTQSVFQENIAVNGGGLNTPDTNLFVENCLFENNDAKFFPERDPSPEGMPFYRAYGHGAAIYTDGANRHEADKYQIIKNCQFINNISSAQGGAVYLYGYRDDVITLEDCTFTGNEVRSSAYGGTSYSFGGGLGISGGELNSREDPNNDLLPLQVFVRNTTFNENRSYNLGGAMFLRLVYDATGTLENCTMVNNSSFAEEITANKGMGGGIAIVGAAGVQEIDPDLGGVQRPGYKKVTLRNMTIVNNTASLLGGGIRVENNNRAAIYNSIVAFNRSESQGNSWNIRHNTSNPFNEGSNNIQTNEFGTSNRWLEILSPDTKIIDPLLEEFTNNGENKWIIALKEGSPAIDAGNDAMTTMTDQIGQSRKRRSDIGAYEWQGTPSGSMSASLTGGNVTICEAEMLDLKVEISGGNSPYDLVLSDGFKEFTVENYLSGTAIPITPNSSANYFLVSVTDADGQVGIGNTGSSSIEIINGEEVSDRTIEKGRMASIRMYGSTNGVSYQLRLDADNSNVGNTKIGTGAHVTFEVTPSETTTYNILATSADGGCSIVLPDKAVITVMDNTPPAFTTPEAVSVDENTEGIIYTTRVNEAAALTLGSTKDESLFEMSPEGDINFINAPDFEAPLDSDADNVYELDIIATDEVGNSAVLDLSITVKNVDDTVSGVIQSHFTDLKVYPNPIINDLLNLDFGETIFGRGTLFNVNGKIVKQFDITSNSIKLNFLSHTPGIYLLVIQSNNNKIATLQLLKQ